MSMPQTPFATVMSRHSGAWHEKVFAFKCRIADVFRKPIRAGRRCVTGKQTDLKAGRCERTAGFTVSSAYHRCQRTERAGCGNVGASYTGADVLSEWGRRERGFGEWRVAKRAPE